MSLPIHNRVSDEVQVNRNLPKQSAHDMASAASLLTPQMERVCKGLGAKEQIGGPTP